MMENVDIKITQWRDPSIIVYTLDAMTPFYVAYQLDKAREAKRMNMRWLMEIFSAYFILGKSKKGSTGDELVDSRSIMAYDGKAWVKKTTRWLLHEFMEPVRNLLCYQENPSRLMFQDIPVERLFLMFGHEYQERSMIEARALRLDMEEKIKDTTKEMRNHIQEIHKKRRVPTPDRDMERKHK